MVVIKSSNLPKALFEDLVAGRIKGVEEDAYGTFTFRKGKMNIELDFWDEGGHIIDSSDAPDVEPYYFNVSLVVGDDILAFSYVGKGTFDKFIFDGRRMKFENMRTGANFSFGEE